MLLEITSWILLVSGGFFIFIGGVGMLRFPDLFTRLHAASVTDTMGAGLTLVGLMLQSGLTLVTLKLFLILLFLFFTGPTAGHALAKAALHGGERPILDDKGDSSSKN
jgi:multicomponent Na+:H+ antiporter subunit G